MMTYIGGFRSSRPGLIGRFTIFAIVPSSGTTSFPIFKIFETKLGRKREIDRAHLQRRVIALECNVHVERRGGGVGRE